MKKQETKHKMKSDGVICVLMLAILATSSWAGTLRDNFDDGNMDGWDLSDAGDIWQVKNGELVITARGFPVQFYIGETTWTNYTVGVRSKIVEHQPTDFLEGASIVVRRESPMHTYVFSFGASGQSKQVRAFYAQGSIAPHHFESKPFQWELDTWYDLRLTAEGNRFKFHMNDELVIDYIDNVYSRGKVGISSAFSETTSHFDDFSVTGDEVPDGLINYVDAKEKLATTWGKIKHSR